MQFVILFAILVQFSFKENQDEGKGNFSNYACQLLLAIYSLYTSKQGDSSSCARYDGVKVSRDTVPLIHIFGT